VLARGVRDVLRRYLGRWTPPGTAELSIVYHPRYQTGVWGVPLDPMRGEKIVASLEHEGLLRRGVLSEPRPASFQSLLRVHTTEYLQSLQDAQVLTRILGVEVPSHEAERTLDLQRLMVGGTIQALRRALRTGGVAVHLGGGFHHAVADRGQGFCIFNDVAVAIAQSRARGYGGRILVVDLDLHDGNGTRAFFAADASVHTFSIHNEAWGDQDAVASTAIPLGPNVDDALYLRTLSASLPPVFEAFRPDLVVYVAGTDTAADDALGNWKLTAEGMLARDVLVASLARDGKHRLPLVVLLAGGYGHAAWRYSARFLSWLATGKAIEPLAEEELTLKRFRRIEATLRPSRPRNELAFELTADDLVGIEPGLGKPNRYLGYFTRHGLELLLERFGLLDQLRARSFRRLRVDLEPGQAFGDTMRITCEDRPGGELLAELRMDRSLGIVPGFEVLNVEWLLLQNPRQSFTERRPPLPGQQHPGLGLLRDVFGLLVVVCEKHGLDGIAFTAAHYHVAMLSRRFLRFLRPEDEARTRGLTEALEGMPLASAAAAVEQGRVVASATAEPLGWTAPPMVLPVSDRLWRLVGGADYEAAVERERPHHAFRVLPVGPTREADTPPRPAGPRAKPHRARRRGRVRAR
jgi:acetoin utilization deacetylase AcuC-like enzyme